MGYLLDTNVVSELRKGDRCNARLGAWRGKIAEEETFLSVLTFGELRRGIESLRSRDVATAKVLEKWMRGLLAAYLDRILPVTLEIAELWGTLSPRHPLPAADGLLAATAAHHGLTLATRNTADFQRCGVDYVNPFE